MLRDAVDEYIAWLLSHMTRVRYVPGEVKCGSVNTVMAYHSDLYQLCQYLEAQGLQGWSEVTGEQMAAYLLYMQEERAYRSATVARKISTVKAFFRYLSRFDHIECDPMGALEAPSLPKQAPQTLSPEQVQCLFAQVDVASPAGLRDLAMLHMLYATGMRVSELVALDLENFHLLRATVICSGQGQAGGQGQATGQGRTAAPTVVGSVGRDRVLPLTSEALEATRLYLEQARPSFLRYPGEEHALFLNHHGERLTRQGFWLIIKGYARSAGIAHITPSILRHAFAFAMLRDGMELRSVQQLLGHAHISTTQVYGQFMHSRTFGE